MVENDPFNAEPGLQAHRSFAQAALGVGVRKVSMGVVEPQAVGQTGQGCNTANGQTVAPAKKQPPLVLETKPKSIPRDRTRLRCPHCKSPCNSRTSFETSALTRTFIYCCTNYECGHTFKAVMEIHYTISPSATPDPAVNLPISTHVRRDLVRTQMDVARSAEHVPEHTEPVTGDLFAGIPPDPPRT